MENENKPVVQKTTQDYLECRRTNEQKKKDRELVRDLYIKRWKNADIKRHPALAHISGTAIWQDIQFVKKQMKTSPVFDKKFKIQKQLETLDELFRETMEAYGKSKNAKIKTFSKTKEFGSSSTSKKGKSKKTEVYDYDEMETSAEGGASIFESGSFEENSYGDPNLLKVALNILAEQNKVLGILGSTKVTEVNLNNNNSQVIVGMQIT